jgi:sugar-specific transcriptional regulator TrmB
MYRPKQSNAGGPHQELSQTLPLDMLCGALEGNKDTVEGCAECYRAVIINKITSEIDDLRLEFLDAEKELASLKSEGSNGAMTWEETLAEGEIARLNEAIKEKNEECNEVKNNDALNCLLEFWKNLLDAHDKETLRASTKRCLLKLIFADPTLGEDQKDAAKKEVGEGVDKLFHEFGDKVASLMAVVKQIRVLSEA